MENEKEVWWDTQPHQKPRLKFQGSFYVLVFFLVLVLLASIMASLIPDSSQPRRGPEQSLEYPVPVQDVLNGCGGIFHFQPIERNYGVIPEETTIDKSEGIPQIPTRIQTYGYMSEESWENDDKRFYSPEDKDVPELPKLLRGMWEGYYVMWYDSKETSPTILNQMKTLSKENTKIIIVPWLSEQAMPMDRKFSYATWNVSQSCAEFDINVARAFTELSDPVYRNRQNPPIAPLNEHNELFSIPRFGYTDVEKPETVPEELQKSSYFYES